MGIADNLKRLREAAGLSQLRLAKTSGVSQQLISQIENGKNTSTKALPALAAAIGCKVSDIDPSYRDETGTSFAIPLLSFEMAARVAREGAKAIPGDVETFSAGDPGPGEWIALRTVDDALDRIAPEGSMLIADLADTDMVAGRFYLIYDEEQGTVFCRRFVDNPPSLSPFSVAGKFKPVTMRPTLQPIARVAMVTTRL